MKVYSRMLVTEDMQNQKTRDTIFSCQTEKNAVINHRRWTYGETGTHIPCNRFRGESDAIHQSLKNVFCLGIFIVTILT
jgi:hypothetical protein